MAGRSLSDVAEIIMGQSPASETCNTEGIGLPLLNGPTEFGPHHPSPVQFTTNGRKRARQGDILFCVRGSTTGRMNWADRDYAIGRGVAAIHHKTERALQPLVRAVIEFSLADLLAQATGSTFPSTFPNVAANQLAEIPWPDLPIPEQRSIAHILGTLDDKIELNRRQNETLEAMARALFKAWFVDFEPVRAKMNLPSPSGRGAGGEGKSSATQNPVKPKLPADLLDFARALRQRMTDAEALLWRLLRNRQLAGLKFRRQHPFPPYVLDFYCHEHKLAVEIDGGQHNEAAGRRHDARRDAFLAEHGLRVLRFSNHDVLQQTEAVLEAIFQAIEAHRLPSPPTPLPEGEGSWGKLGVDGAWHWPQHILDLFPDRLVESELGEIPEGWRYSTIGEEVTVCGGSTPSTKEPGFWEGGQHCWATPKDLSALKFPVLLDTERKITDAGLAKISSGLLPVGTVLLSSRAPIGYLAIAEVPTAINQGFIAIKCDGTLPNIFVMLWCKENLDAIVGNANGSTFLEISKSNFRPLRIVVPSDQVLTNFAKMAGSLYRQLVKNERESRTLAQLRDTLLPKLISGELRVRDAEAFLKERGL